MNAALWTEKHSRFCLKHRLSPSARHLWQWLIEHQNPDRDEIEFDLTGFNKWVAKHRGEPYDPRTLKRAAESLVSSGAAIDIARDRFTWNWRRWILRPLELIIDFVKPRNSRRNRTQNAEIMAESIDLSSAGTYSSSINNYSSPNTQDEANKEEVVEECAKAGVTLNPNKKAELFRYTYAEIKASLALLQRRGGAERLNNPIGWLVECLRASWWEDVPEVYAY